MFYNLPFYVMIYNCTFSILLLFVPKRTCVIQIPGLTLFSVKPTYVCYSLVSSLLTVANLTMPKAYSSCLMRLFFLAAITFIATIGVGWLQNDVGHVFVLGRNDAIHIRQAAVGGFQVFLWKIFCRKWCWCKTLNKFLTNAGSDIAAVRHVEPEDISISYVHFTLFW